VTGLPDASQTLRPPERCLLAAEDRLFEVLFKRVNDSHGRKPSTAQQYRLGERQHVHRLSFMTQISRRLRHALTPDPPQQGVEDCQPWASHALPSVHLAFMYTSHALIARKIHAGSTTQVRFQKARQGVKGRALAESL
jgi:hypothetical protein